MTMKRDLVFPAPPAWAQAPLLAKVISLDDPQQLNRVQVRLLAFDDAAQQDAPMWARVVAPFAGDDRGAFFLPDLDDEVLVVFAQGDPRHPLIVGGLWNGSASPPATIDNGRNRTKRIKSKNGIVVTLEDQDGQEKLQLETPGGCKLTLKDGPGGVTLKDSNGNTFQLQPAGVSLQAAAKVSVQAPMVEVSAGMVKVDAAFSQFSGMVKCNMLMADAVISSAYTQGAGNVW